MNQATVQERSNDRYIEQVETLTIGFTYELCGECGYDLDAHIIAPDALGNAHAYCQIGDYL